MEGMNKKNCRNADDVSNRHKMTYRINFERK